MSLSAPPTPPGSPGGPSGPGRDAPGPSGPRAVDTLLADRGQLFRALFLAAPIGKAVVGLDGRLLVVNPAMCTLTGRSADELVGRL